jgi:hypothetical protein
MNIKDRECIFCFIIPYNTHFFICNYVIDMNFITVICLLVGSVVIDAELGREDHGSIPQL